MGIYADSIKAAAGIEDDALAALVEEFMRTNRSGLDGLPAYQFTREARQAAQDAYLWHCASGNPEALAHIAGGVSLADYCESMGLAYPKFTP